ncbi:MAG: hypothetical protein ACK457_08940, partial [Flavobacteriia bacterium]
METAHVPLVIVHLNVAVVPAGTAVTEVPGELGVVMVAVPETTDHRPVPTLGVLPVLLNVPLFQLYLSMAAFE